jgi:16S rRNA (guanine527-N7)-methyltransferase
MESDERGEIFRLAREWSVDVTVEMVARLERFCAVLLEWNKRVNLTGARNFDDLEGEHLPDSFAAARLIPPNSRVVDVGSGGGLPAVPLAILRPDCSLTLVEPRGRRVAFLNTAVRTCACRNIRVVQGRSDDKGMGGFDLATSRATFVPEEWLELGKDLVGRPGRVLVFTTAEMSSGSARLVGSFDYRLRSGATRWAGLFLVAEP